MTIKRSPTGWCVKLTDRSEVALMGAEWIPLPLSRECSESEAVRFCAATKMYQGEGVTIEADGMSRRAPVEAR